MAAKKGIINLIDSLFLWLTSILAFFTILTIFSQFMESSFRFFAISGIGGILVISIAYIIFIKKHIPWPTRDELLAIILIFVAGTISAVIPLTCHLPDADDCYYVPNAVYHLEHPLEPMDFEIHSLIPAMMGEKITSFSWGTSSAYEYLQASLAYALNLNFLTLYHIIFPGLMGFLIPIALFKLYFFFSNQWRYALIAACLTTAVILLLGETHRTFGSCFLTRIFQGKIVCMTLGLYLFIAQTLQYFKKPNVFSWLCLAMTITGMVGLTATTIVLFPVMSIVLVLAIFSCGQEPFSIARISRYYSAFLILAGYGLFLRSHSLSHLGIDSPINAGWPVTFWGHARFFFNPHKPITLAVVLISTVLGLWGSLGIQRRFLIAWIVLVFCLVLNPLVAPMMIRFVTTPNIYWRLFYIYPFPLLLGIAIMGLLRKIPTEWHLKVTLTGIIFISIFHLVPGSSSALQQNVRFGMPRYKLDVRSYQLAKRVLESAPSGPMLALPEISRIIPMLSSRFPQVRIRESGEQLWFGATAAALRIRATRFANTGKMSDFSAFKNLVLKWNPRLQSIVMRKQVFEESKVEAVLHDAGFTCYQSIDHGFVIISH